MQRGCHSPTHGGEAVRIESYQDARLYAERRANESGLDVTIRRVKEYGWVGYNIAFAAINDSDYARSEIVRPVEVKRG